MPLFQFAQGERCENLFCQLLKAAVADAVASVRNDVACQVIMPTAVLMRPYAAAQRTWMISRLFLLEACQSRLTNLNAHGCPLQASSPEEAVSMMSLPCRIAAGYTVTYVHDGEAEPQAWVW
jgi:hypothetical protein